MRELAVQSANGTLTDDRAHTDVGLISVAEVTRIAETQHGLVNRF